MGFVQVTGGARPRETARVGRCRAGRQMPEFRGLSGRMGAVLARPSDFDSIGSTLAIFRLAGNGVGIVGCCRRQRIMDVKCDVADRRAFPIVGPGWCGISAWN